MKRNINELNFTEGETILVNKPYTWSSFGVVTQLKKWTQAKIGHAGTLDPLASGLMICCTGKFTKKLTALIGCDKEYTGIIRIGETTPTYDLESIPENKKDISAISNEMVLQTIEQFKGEIEQFPPIHSAIKQQGKPVYELAREGKEVVMKSRRVTIHSFEITAIQLPEIHFKINCSSGTYIRSIANDVGAKLGVGGFLQALCRTKIGEYDLQDAYSIDELKAHFGTSMNIKEIKPKVIY